GGSSGNNFAVGRTLISGFIAVQTVEASRGRYVSNYIVRERFQGGQDSDVSASSIISSGADFVFSGKSFLNAKSTISAVGNISIQSGSFKNIGAVS
ncbi:hypothetical protein, partial [Pseudomonas viridiflava]